MNGPPTMEDYGAAAATRGVRAFRWVVWATIGVRLAGLTCLCALAVLCLLHAQQSAAVSGQCGGGSKERWPKLLTNMKACRTAAPSDATAAHRSASAHAWPRTVFAYPRPSCPRAPSPSGLPR